MKIVCLQSPLYDLVTASISEGLQELGHEIIAAETSNYLKGESRVNFRKAAESADVILDFSGFDVRRDLLDGIEHPARFFVDGGDEQEFHVYPGIRYRGVFKRELNKQWAGLDRERIFPLPFAAEKRYFLGETLKRDIEVSFAANLSTNVWRYSVNQRLLNRKHPGIYVGNTGECVHGTVGNALSTPKFHELLRRSRVAVSVAGRGYDCARYWEILASGAMLLTQKPDIVVPHPLQDGRHSIEYRSLEEFEEKLDFVLANPQDVDCIAAAGLAHIRAHHTSCARAQQLLDAVKIATQQPVWCESFYHPDQVERMPNKQRWKLWRRRMRQKLKV